MANKLSAEKKTTVVAMLCEGASIRGIERMTGVNRNTVMSLGLRMGEGCQKIIGGTTASVIGILAIVMKSLFPTKTGKKF